VEVVRKDIKHLHLAVYPPDGRVRVAAPLRVEEEAVKLAVVTRLGWIRRKQESLRLQDRQSEREYVTGETHYFLGRRLRLRLVDEPRSSVRVAGPDSLEMRVPAETSAKKRGQVMHEWYRRELRDRVPALLERWEPRVGVDVSAVGIKRMRTRWGSCNADARRVWLNLELAKKPPRCTEYVLVHEMVHILERRHNERFRSLMDDFLPSWRLHRDALNQEPLAYEDWTY
jgi:predicted metal-dependent hydrolase